MHTNIDIWERELACDEDKDFILEGLRSGFRIIEPDAKLESAECDNYKSTTCHDNIDLVETQIREEITAGRYVVCSHKPTIVSALGAVPKPGANKIRLIHDCSRPAGRGVNAYANTQSFAYDTLDDAINLLHRGGFMAKIDLKNAYRCVPIHPDCYEATGLKWKFRGSNEHIFMFDSRLGFGMAKSPEIFQRITKSVTRMMKRRGFEIVIVYLDDFLIIANSKYECEQAYQCLLDLLLSLGFDINWDKVVPPSQRLIFLGVFIDSMQMTGFSF